MLKKVVIILLSTILVILSTSPSSSAKYITSKSQSKLVDIREMDPTIIIDLRYATNNNFTKKKLYSNAIPLLRKETALKLAKVNKEVAKKGYRIKVWDAYRPFSAQQVLWNAAKDKRYVANPNKGSIHNRGGAVDITLVDKKGRELKMPTGFDNFTSKASRNYSKMDKTAKTNVTYLTNAMKKHGFTTINDEWWHYTDKNWTKYPILNIPLRSFK